MIAIASLAGVVAEAGLASYGASKAALIALCESITVEEAGSGVTATAISPGYVDTEMSAWITERIPTAEMITADDVAQLALAACRLSATRSPPTLCSPAPAASSSEPELLLRRSAVAFDFSLPERVRRWRDEIRNFIDHVVIPSKTSLAMPECSRAAVTTTSALDVWAYPGSAKSRVAATKAGNRVCCYPA